VDGNALGPQRAARVDNLVDALAPEQRPLTMRVAPIWMISSPAEGSSPVVSVSKTV
jgi:hypothetical protein